MSSMDPSSQYTIEEIATELEEAILIGEYENAKELLQMLENDDERIAVEKAFKDRDPVVCAIAHREEDIAILMIETGFSMDKAYERHNGSSSSGMQIEDQPQERYTAYTLAQENKLYKVQKFMEERSPNLIEEKRKPVQIVEPFNISPRARGSTRFARETLDKFGCHYTDNKGNTFLHECALNDTPFAVYVYAHGAVPVNAQNSSGDTALHLAVVYKKRDVARALLQCGANLGHRNQLGQTPLDKADGIIKKLLQEYELGLGIAISKAHVNTLKKLMNNWCSVHTIIKDGKTGFQLAEELAQKNERNKKCFQNVVLPNLQTNELIHKIDCELNEEVEKVLDSKNVRNINVRYKNKYGRTVLVNAIERYNTELVTVLLKNGAAVDIRVTDDEEENETVPLVFKAIQVDCPADIIKALVNQDQSILKEMGPNGNNGFHQAIECGLPIKTIKWINDVTAGNLLSRRNMKGLLPRELAWKLGRTDLVREIDEYVGNMQEYDRLLAMVNFYGDMSVIDKKNEDLLKKLKIVESKGCALHHAGMNGDLETIKKLNTATYRDRNGLTVLHRAIVYKQIEAIELITRDRPSLKLVPDNCNRYPLHYAYALVEEEGAPLVKLLVRKNPEEVELTRDKDGRIPADYIKLRETLEIFQMLEKARVCNCYGEVDAAFPI